MLVHLMLGSVLLGNKQNPVLTHLPAVRCLVDHTQVCDCRNWPRLAPEASARISLQLVMEQTCNLLPVGKSIPCRCLRLRQLACSIGHVSVSCIAAVQNQPAMIADCRCDGLLHTHKGLLATVLAKSNLHGSLQYL